MDHIWPQRSACQQSAIGKSIISIWRCSSQRRASTELFPVNLPPLPCLVLTWRVPSHSAQTCWPMQGHRQEFVSLAPELCHHARYAHSSHLGPAGLWRPGLSAAFFRAKPAKMNKVHPQVTLTPHCKHAAAQLLLFNCHLLLLQDSQNDCTCPLYPVQMHFMHIHYSIIKNIFPPHALGKEQWECRNGWSKLVILDIVVFDS